MYRKSSSTSRRSSRSDFPLLDPLRRLSSEDSVPATSDAPSKELKVIQDTYNRLPAPPEEEHQLTDSSIESLQPTALDGTAALPMSEILHRIFTSPDRSERELPQLESDTLTTISRSPSGDSLKQLGSTIQRYKPSPKKSIDDLCQPTADSPSRQIMLSTLAGSPEPSLSLRMRVAVTPEDLEPLELLPSKSVPSTSEHSGTVPCLSVTDVRVSATSLPDTAGGGGDGYKLPSTVDCIGDVATSAKPGCACIKGARNPSKSRRAVRMTRHAVLRPFVLKILLGDQLARPTAELLKAISKNQSLDAVISLAGGPAGITPAYMREAPGPVAPATVVYNPMADVPF
ncbi:MAG: hypothetical protein M1818_001595 [Claussenomyces sp. TS43310]|nr:MAG: hypothetical protein M1818_001595 [Claussenomyces sp. TS43310]